MSHPPYSPTRQDYAPPQPPTRQRRHWVAPVVTGAMCMLIGVGIGSAGHATAVPQATTASSGATAPAPPAAVPGPATSFTDGTYTIPDELAPGTYHTDGQSTAGLGCGWERDRNTDGQFSSIIANNFGNGPQTVTVAKTDKALTVSGGCTWTRK